MDNTGQTKIRLVIELPTMRAQKWMFREMEGRNVISFVYDEDVKR